MRKPFTALFTLGIAAATVLVAGVPGALAELQDSQKAQQAAQTKDAAVLTKLHLTNQMEIKAGELAREKAQSDEIKEFGQHLAQQHRESDQQIQELAKQAEIPLDDPHATEKKKGEQQVLMNKLQVAEREKFDQVFTDSIASGHRQMLAELQQDRKDVTNESVRRLIDQTIPVLEQHWDRAEELRRVAREQ